MINVSDPRGASGFVEWADDNYETFVEFGFLPKATTEAAWQDWGAALLLMRDLVVFNIPDPYQFTDWREWAIRLMQAVGAGA